MIEFKNVSKGYKNQRVLNDLSFRIDNNDLTLLVGRNGSGKSTTINLILGMLKIGKSDLGEIENDFVAVSYFPERFNMPSLIRSHNFLYTYFSKERSRKEIASYIDRYKILNKCICNLSKGMGQKVILVKTLLEESELYIFDEPLNGLDDASKDLFLEDLKMLISRGKTIIISTHDPEFFLGSATKIIRLGDNT